MKSNEQSNDTGPSSLVSSELRDIKRLLVLISAKAGASQAEIAKALGVNQTTVGRQFRLGKVKPFSIAVPTVATE